MKQRIPTIEEFVNEKQSQYKYYKQSAIKKGMKVKCNDDSEEPHPTLNTVEIISSTKDKSGMYDVKVKFIGGENDGLVDKWYLENDDTVFIKENESLNEGNGDYVAAYGKTIITIKNGYSIARNESMLDALYETIGKAVKDTGISVASVIVKLK